jgi:hypothetical protein
LVSYYRSHKDDSSVIDPLNNLAEQKPTRGFPYYFNRLRNEGHPWNHKRVKRVYNLMSLNLRRKRRRRLPQRVGSSLEQAPRPNQTWSMDFMHDILMNGRKVRILNIIGDYNRQALAMDVDYHIPASVFAAFLKGSLPNTAVRLSFAPTMALSSFLQHTQTSARNKASPSATSSPENPCKMAL